MSKRALERNDDGLNVKKRRPDLSDDDDDSSEDDVHPGFGSAKRPLEASKESQPRKKDSSDDDDDNSSEGDAHVGFGSSKRPLSAPEKSQLRKKGPGYSDFAKKYMTNLGYEEGKGLGKHGDGIIAPIIASRQRGRRGLGLSGPVAFEEDDELTWNEEEQITAHEPLEWIDPCEHGVPTSEELAEWKEAWTPSQKKLVIDDETYFCDGDLLKALLKQKTVFDHLEGEQMRQARTRSNPFETIRNGIFLNRAAMKMANMDFLCDFMFTSPKDANGQPLVGPNELLYFADVCAGPGGFSEYALWRRKWNTKGFGFTLKGANDFKLEDFFAGSPEFFEPHYGVDGLHGNGDIMKGTNLKVFRKFVWENTDQKGVHFVMADGGFSVAGQENIQEILTKQLLLCQFLTALSILREGGHFVCKTFDLFTPFSMALIYVLYRVFEKVSILKCNTSRPANSERYVICQSLKRGHEPTHDFLFDLNERLNEVAGEEEDILHILPLHLILEDKNFTEYVTAQNNRQAQTQITALAKIQTFCRNTNLIEPRQAELRRESLKLWEVPGISRSAPRVPDAMTKFRELCHDENADVFDGKPEPLSHDSIKTMTSIYDYRCVMSAGERLFVLGVGRSHVYQWNGKRNSRWRKLDGCQINLPGDTLFEAEVLEELRGEGSGQKKIKAFHIIDALWLGGEDVRKIHYTERMQKAALFVKALHKPTRTDFSPLRVKDLFKMEQFEEIFKRLDMRRSKGYGGRYRLSYIMPFEERHFIPTGVHFIKTISDPWTMVFSKTHRRKYFFNKAENKSSFDCPPGSVAPYSTCAKTQLHWAWEDGVQIHHSHPKQNPNKMSKEDVLHLVQTQRIV